MDRFARNNPEGFASGKVGSPEKSLAAGGGSVGNFDIVCEDRLAGDIPNLHFFEVTLLQFVVSKQSLLSVAEDAENSRLHGVDPGDCYCENGNEDSGDYVSKVVPAGG